MSKIVILAITLIFVALITLPVLRGVKLVYADTCQGDETRSDCKVIKSPEPKNPTKDILPFIGTITRPPELAYIDPGAKGIGYVLSRILEIIYVVAMIVFLFMMVFGAFQWMTSGGNKEAVGNAQRRITHAIIGFVLLAFVALIASLIGRITGFQFFAT